MPAPRNAAKANSRVNRGTLGARVPLVALPSGGCDLPVPDPPAGCVWSDAQRSRWEELWRSPQATQWDETARGTVALVVLYEAAVFEGTASAWQAQELRYAAEALGLTPRALASLGWQIAE